MPDWLSKILGRFESVEAKLDKLTPDAARIAALEAELADTKAKLASAESQRDSAQDKAIAAAEKHTAEFAALQTKLTEAENKATEAIASQGIPASAVPAAQPTSGTGETPKPELKGLDRVKAAFAAERQK